MVELRRFGPTVVAVVVAVTVTLGFTVGLPYVASDGSENVSSTDGSVPAPTSDEFDADGDPPATVNDFPTFSEVGRKVGVRYQATYRGRAIMTSSGVYVADFNNDGYEDLLALGGDRPVLFENTHGNFTKARAFNHSDVRSAHFFDFDNDGWRDLLLAQYGGELLFYENTGGSFERRDVGLDRQVRNPTAITTADFTGDGYLDVFVGQNGLWQSNSALNIQEQREVYDYHPHVRPRTSPANPNLLFDGNGENFTDITETAGIRGSNWTLAVSAADFTGNGYPDIHVGNDFSADIIYENNGNGTFDRRTMGVASDRNAMASAVQDMNGDHHLDLYVTNVYIPARAEMNMPPYDMSVIIAVPEGNNYYVNDGSGEFTDRAAEKGVRKGGWGWAATIADYNNDGHLDIVHGASSAIPVEPYDEYDHIQMFKGTPGSWQKVNETDHGMEEISTRGIARVDFDNDGRLDIAVATSSWGRREEVRATEFRLYENHPGSGESLQLFVRDPNGVERNGAVYVKTDRRVIRRTVNARSGFNSQDSRLIHVGTAHEEVQSVTVVWPSGNVTTYDSLESGNRYVLKPNSAERVE
jgi:hypothetical protein